MKNTYLSTEEHPYHRHCDEDLVSLLLLSDKKAFEVIFRRYAKRLYDYAKRNISLKEDCEELIQEVFESLWQRRKNLSHVTVLDAYLFRMVKYKVIRYFRNSQMRKNYAEHFTLFEAVYDTVPEAEHDSATISSLIEKSISKLPERCQFALKLRLHENLSNNDIAKRMNITKKTVEAYMYKAFDHLRKNRHDLVRTN